VALSREESMVVTVSKLLLNRAIKTTLTFHHPSRL
jgi:hypothetical protein